LHWRGVRTPREEFGDRVASASHDRDALQETVSFAAREVSPPTTDVDETIAGSFFKGIEKRSRIS
jgi:hypothetical protein